MSVGDIPGDELAERVEIAVRAGTVLATVLGELLSGLLFGQHGVVLEVPLVAGLADGEAVMAPRGGEFDFAVWLHDSLLMND